MNKIDTCPFCNIRLDSCYYDYSKETNFVCGCCKINIWFDENDRLIWLGFTIKRLHVRILCGANSTVINELKNNKTIMSVTLLFPENLTKESLTLFAEKLLNLQIYS